MGHGRSIRVLRDDRGAVKRRVEAARDLVNSDAEGLAALLNVAEDESTLEEVASAVGEAIAAILMRTNRLYDISFADFSGPAYAAFDDAVARMQKQERDSPPPGGLAQAK